MVQETFKDRCRKHLCRLKEPLTIDKYSSRFEHLNDTDKKEIETNIKLSLKLFEKLKEDGHHTLKQRYPNSDLENNEELAEFLERDFRKINNIFKTGKSDEIITQFCEQNYQHETAIRFKLFEYLIFCESILFLFEDIIKHIAKEKNPKQKLDYLTMGKLQKHIINNSNYDEFKNLFYWVDKNLRNSIGHSDYEIDNKTIKYFYYNKEINQLMSEILIEDFLKKLLKISILFDILLYQIDKPFVDEISHYYSSILDE